MESKDPSAEVFTAWVCALVLLDLAAWQSSPVAHGSLSVFLSGLLEGWIPHLAGKQREGRMTFAPCG